MNEIKIAVAAQRLLNAAERVCASLSLGSAAFAKFAGHKELQEAVAAARKALEQTK